MNRTEPRTNRRRMPAPRWSLALALVLAWGALGQAGVRAQLRDPDGGAAGRPPEARAEPLEEGAAPERGTIELHRARKPTGEERARVLRWHRIWRQEAGPLRGLLGRLGTADRAAPVADRQWCGALGRAVLAVDRERVFPVPSYGVDARLRRALACLVRAATACFEGRPHEAAFRLSQAHGAFAEAGRLLRPYRVAP